MRKFIKGKEYLCGVGSSLSKKIHKYEVGISNGVDVFSFSNADYSPTELAYRRSYASNSTCVISARLIK